MKQPIDRYIDLEIPTELAVLSEFYAQLYNDSVTKGLINPRVMAYDEDGPQLVYEGLETDTEEATRERREKAQAIYNAEIAKGRYIGYAEIYKRIREMEA